MCGCVCVFSVFVSVCGCVCVCVSSLCLLTLMNEPNIRAICYQSSINQPQITSGNMFLKRASDVRCCLLWVSLCINQRGYARSCVCVTTCTIFPYCISWVHCVKVKWRISLSRQWFTSTDNSLFSALLQAVHFSSTPPFRYAFRSFFNSMFKIPSLSQHATSGSKNQSLNPDNIFVKSS